MCAKILYREPYIISLVYGHYFVQHGFIQVCTFHYSFGKLVFCFYVLFVFSACSEFDLIFINFDNICIIIIYIVDARYSVLLFSPGEISRHKNLITALHKKHASRELLKFKNSICKEKCGTFTT